MGHYPVAPTGVQIGTASTTDVSWLVALSSQLPVLLSAAAKRWIQRLAVAVGFSHSPSHGWCGTPATMVHSPTIQERREAWIRRRVMTLGILCAVAYGLVARAQIWFGATDGGQGTIETVFKVMSVGFIFGVPLAVGFIAVFVGRVRSFGRAIIFPQIPTLVALGTSLLLAWEGIICIWLWLPLFSLLAALGGVLGAIALRIRSPLGRGSSFGVMLLIPYGGMFAERGAPPPGEVRTVETYIDVSAPASAVWEEIVEVPKIQPDEHSFALSHFIGFPRPVAAVCDDRGVGSVREASFERGVVFHERVTKFDVNKELSFSIHADPSSIPARALDEHVTVGGPYFDVLQGTYRLESRPGGVRLYLSSEHRLSTRFNVYSGFWTDFIMRDTQEYILEIVSKRAESRGTGPRGR